MIATLHVRPRGPFSLEALATFGFGQRQVERFDGVMRLAFCLDGYRQQVGVEVRQDQDGVHGVVHGEVAEAQLDAVSTQVQRVLSLDHDGERFLDVGRRDPVIGQLQAAAPGLRPPLFYSPFEAAAWAVLSARRPAREMAEVRTALADAHGRTFDLAGERLSAFPTPSQLLELNEFPGLTAEKIERLHGVARAALDGQLDAARVRSIDPDVAMRDLQGIRGIGPFYSALIVIRASGVTDVLPHDEPRMRDLVRRLYGLSGPPDAETLRRIAEPWRPWRTWTAVLVRAAGPRLAPP